LDNMAIMPQEIAWTVTCRRIARPAII